MTEIDILNLIFASTCIGIGLTIGYLFTVSVLDMLADLMNKGINFVQAKIRRRQEND